MPISFTAKGNWDKTDKFLNKAKRGDFFAVLEKYGEQGVRALQGATPKNTGRTAEAWTYQIESKSGYHSIHWLNTHEDSQGHPIAVLLQYGHGTRQGGYVQGRDYINPAIRPIFDEIANAVWKVVNQ